MRPDETEAISWSTYAVIAASDAPSLGYGMSLTARPPALDADAERRPMRAPVVETIATAALRVGGEVWTLPRPSRHHVLIRAWSIAHYRDGENGRIGDHEQGFVTSAGRFVDRHEAARIARAAGQTESTRASLFSEDVW